MLKLTTTTLKKLEELFGELGYEVRYEKGQFQSGHCLVEAKKIAVVSKFFDTEARCSALLDILSNLETDSQLLSEKSLDLIKKWQKGLDSAEKDSENAVFKDANNGEKVVGEDANNGDEPEKTPENA